jgi:translation initiation factor IF-2
VTDGELRRNARLRVLRGGQPIAEGEVGSLRHLQEDVHEVRQGFDCGVSLKNFADYVTGDILECFVREKA